MKDALHVLGMILFIFGVCELRDFLYALLGHPISGRKQ